MKKIRILVVGVGPRGLNWLKVIKKSPIVNLVGVCDLQKNTKDSLKLLKLDNIPFDVDIKKSINKFHPEVVLLSTPPFNRMRDIKICAANNLPVLVEKPLTTNIKEAKKIVEIMLKKKLLLMVGLNFRYLPVTQQFMNLLNKGTVGKPAYAKFIYERWRDGKLNFLNKYPLIMDHPMLWEQSIHHFDLIRYTYNSDVKSVYALTWNPKWSMYKHHTNVSALLKLKNGMIVNYHGTWQGNSTNFNFEWRTECEKGTIIQKDQFSDLYYNKKESSKLIKIPLKKITMWKYDAELLLKDFIRSLEDVNRIKTAGKDHIRSLAIVEACINSAKKGRKININ
ncbi:MAG: oxidoreductase [Rhodospirillaceae bacterium]|jgi:predicted dehydrogenase|nr:oxidoreductase [Rhodospirillaceae bacterium]|tara:strand:- start:493 stop:1503 length:1011 start_codon:yes stop_codon:yes gene_type:complete